MVWNGTAWVPFMINGSQIVASTVTATQLAAGIIYAGIVNGTQILGGDFLAGTAPNPQVEITDNAGSGILRFLMNNAAYANQPIIEGNNIGSFAQLLLNGPARAGTVHNDYVGFELNSSDGTSFANLEAVYNPPGGGTAVLCWFIDANGTTFPNGAVFNGPAQVSVAAGLGPFIPGETWHVITTAGWTGTCRVKKLPWNAAWLDIHIVSTGSTAGGAASTMGSLPDTTYYPTVAQRFPAAVRGPFLASSGTFPGSPAWVFIPTGSGGIQVVLPPFTASTASVGIDATVMYPLNLWATNGRTYERLLPSSWVSA
jgi:hypothetical protein